MKTIPQHTLDFIDSWLELRSKWAEYPGFTVAVAKEGEILFNKSYGYADIETKKRLTPDHIFRVASHSKTFTATAIMQLQEGKSLRIDDPVVNYLSWLKEHKDRRWRDVTIRQLLSHSAGVIRDGLNAEYWQVRQDFPDEDEFKTEILKTDLVLEPNTKMKYSNYGYSLLGLVIEEAGGQTYADFVRDHIIKPLGLQNTTPELEDGQNLATGYSRQTIEKTRYAFPHINTGAMASATGFCSTSADLCSYFSAHIIGSGKLLKDTSKREMQRKAWEVEKEHGDAYGLGFDVVQIGSRQLFGHSGGFPGFATRTWCDPDDKLVVAVFANAHATMPGVIAKSIIGLIDEFGDEPPSETYKKYEVRLSDLYGTYDVIAHAGGVRGIYSNSWWPLDSVDKFEVIDEVSLKTVETSGFNDLGELVRYTFDDSGKVRHVVLAGHRMRPSLDGNLEKTWK